MQCSNCFRTIDPRDEDHCERCGAETCSKCWCKREYCVEQMYADIKADEEFEQDRIERYDP